MSGRDAIVAIIICLLAVITAVVVFHKKIIKFLALWMADAKNAAAAVKESKSSSSDIDLEAAKSEPSARSEARSGSNKSDDRCDTASSASSGPDLHVRTIL
ncbi:hypothetical protein SMACR_00683 [Sordaria macrospora]|uniref:WGS project CABT00000000 data, contig 2.2 n=2 Tax=Sordaria macrospora TaxID=5147 RepID=F7VMS9_SORMK|nr:uncharacterized protein SMAC_00683 [Sordaria macrospora k-hell]KAA8633910.1 hypothetical protein SMACR_00683 [Sordaria macrospora]KAH7630184.1 hypothetical protein B0T09DRAFT_144162 [Sordaria sp. MPI-SDFR-AT-0083]WPJ66857.1 hypothetical protein SMAC4_00683 [Sordaria macrospora]CCC06658.1 unnamed protein product [Sordaria macrospora k-hell]